MGTLEERFTRPQNWVDGTFKNARGHDLYFGQLREHEKPLAHIVYVSGLSEFTEKTYELARDFNKASCNFSNYDRPGQGRSPRLLADAFKQHSTGIQHSVDDLIAFCKAKVPKGEPLVLLGHSTGGLIALLAMAKEPELFKGAILTGPLLGFQNPITYNREAYFSRLPLPNILYEKYIPAGGPWLPRSAPNAPTPPEAFSGDPIRNKLHDHWMQANPQLRCGSPTFGWVKHKCQGIVELHNLKTLQKITQPVLIFTGGRDHLVRNDMIGDIAKKLKDAQLVHFQDAGHEILMEKDDIRNPLLYKFSIPFLKNKL